MVDCLSRYSQPMESHTSKASMDSSSSLVMMGKVYSNMATMYSLRYSKQYLLNSMRPCRARLVQSGTSIVCSSRFTTWSRTGLWHITVPMNPKLSRSAVRADARMLGLGSLLHCRNVARMLLQCPSDRATLFCLNCSQMKPSVMSEIFLIYSFSLFVFSTIFWMTSSHSFLGTQTLAMYEMALPAPRRAFQQGLTKVPSSIILIFSFERDGNWSQKYIFVVRSYVTEGYTRRNRLRPSTVAADWRAIQFYASLAVMLAHSSRNSSRFWLRMETMAASASAWRGLSPRTACWITQLKFINITLINLARRELLKRLSCQLAADIMGGISRRGVGQQRFSAHSQQFNEIIQMAERVEIKMSAQLKEKVDAAREYIENKYSKLRKTEEDRRNNWNMFEEKANDMRLSEEQKDRIRQEILQQEAELLRKKRSKITAHDFESLAIIGKGAFGEVRLCREHKTNEIVAIKRLKKKEMLKKNQVAHIRAERNVLVHGNPWIVSLKYSFQDDVYLYLVMEFLQGGDLMTLLIKRNILSEEQSRFYISEMILAIESVHKMNYIHRDLKPDNILIDNRGHIKLSDFGLCKQAQIRKLDQRKQKDSQFTFPKPEVYLKNLPEIKRRHQRNRQLAYSAVGTPDYIAPEMLRQSGYTETVDWWSIGVILYEMLVGYAPFSSDSNEEIYYKIEHHEEYLVFPDDVDLSDEVIDLIHGLVCEEEVRLGRNGVSEIKNHRWFKGFNWKTVQQTKAPFIPLINSDTDVSNFDHYDEQQPWAVQSFQKPAKKDFNFIGYTFKQDGEDNQRLLMVNALEKLERTHSSMFRKPQPGQTKPNKENANKTDFVRYHVDDFGEAEETARSKEPLHPRDSFKENSSKALKQFLRQDNNKTEQYKQALKDTGYLQLKKPSSSKSPQHPIMKKSVNSSQQATNSKYECTISQLAGRIHANQPYVNPPKAPPSPNFAALIQSIKQKEHSKEREVTPRSFKGSEKATLQTKPKTKTIGVKFREYLK